jgi:serine/threonine-protein kinase RsbT
VSEGVVEHHEMRIDTEDDIMLVRRKVRELAQTCGFDVFATSAVTTATSELARNVWVHAGKGIALIDKLMDDARLGVRVVFKDEGPGIPDVERVLRGGYSTAKSMGLGLSGSRRLVDEFAVDSQVGHGTTITFTKWAGY